MELKKCTKCGVDKNPTEFHKNRACKDGLSTHCKDCRREYKKGYRAQNKEALREENRRYRLENSDLLDAARKKWRAENREQTNQYAKRWKLKNPDAVRKNNARRRAAKADAVQGEYYPTYQEMVDFYGTNCLFPGCESDPMDRTIDHIVAYANGGANGLWNLMPLCLSHNTSKQHLHSTDYRNTKWVERIDGRDVIYRPYERDDAP